MPRVRECLYQEKNHHGTNRYRFIRHRGAPKIGIKGNPGEAEFEQRYHYLLSGGDAEHTRASRRKARKSRHDEGTFADLVSLFLAYMDSEVAKGAMADRTRNTYGGILKRTATILGTASVASFTKVDINQLLSALTSSAATHNNMLKAIRAMFKFAVDQTHMINDDPTYGVKYVPNNTEGHSEWTREQLMQFLVRHPKGTTAHLTVTLLLYTACRRSDVVKLGPSNLKSRDGKSYIEFRQTKGDGGEGSLVIVPVDDHFMDVLNSTRTGNIPS